MLISVIIPVYNGGVAFQRCLVALSQSRYANWEGLVVDDGSTDGSAELARQAGLQVLPSARAQSGPAAARNLGAQAAQGEILYFIDADVLVKTDTLDKVVANFENDPSLAACFGSYDDEPAEENLLSQYKNLQHHFVHQTAQTEASTFWSGCGAIRREIFLEMDGFDAGYGRPSIEDIQLGYRLRAAGYRIRLDKELQVKHLKRWTARSLLTTDIRDRAIPWSRLILSGDKVINDLNLQTEQRLSTVAAFLGLGSLLAGLRWPRLWGITGTAVAALLFLNRRFYRFLARKRGPLFTAQALPWHWLYFIYSGLAFGLVFLWTRLRKLNT